MVAITGDPRCRRRRVEEHTQRARALSDDPAIESQLLGLPGNLCLQISYGPRNLSLLARTPNPNRIQLSKLRAQLPISLAQPLDFHLELGTLLRRFEPVVARVESPELIDDVHRKCCEHSDYADDDQTACRRMRADDEVRSSVRGTHG